MSFIRADVYKAITDNNLNDVVFQDPFSDEARKAKRNLVAASFGALLIAALDLQVNGFLGLQTVTGSTLGVVITKGLACVVVLYFLAGFVLYASVDYAAWKFKRERFLVAPYLELVKMLEAHVNSTGEQVTNATSRLGSIVIESDMQSQVAFQEAIKNTKGQLASIQEHTSQLHEEMRPLIGHWRLTVAKASRLSWRLRARFLSLWLLDMLFPLALSALAMWKSHEGLPLIFERIAG
ncbi:hypothetical protein QSH18_16940 [Xanthomonas sp. NCPPB 2654]|uniref:hypothetical protein n=1 Tax=unclassified Xanthomonas TaxID=2643310 RepID=UPI0021E02FDC|nr:MULTISPECIES: hypothetical protein [unclassified Xanthomonas]MDL5367297.1 hypothetical protein [Xanthomonas sp. NCPPB 2654]UYC19581.1 hypothetical protein NUG20_15540 [Xanthomonas sp. CFBP 8443]